MTPLNRQPNAGPDPRLVPRHKPFHVLSFDPGGTTGWSSAGYMDPVQQLTSYKQIKFESGQISARESNGKLIEHHRPLWHFLEARVILGFTEIVCESFEFRQHLQKDNAKHKVELVSRDYIGIIKLFCALTNTKLTMNTASTGKAFVTDEKLKLINLWTPGNPHANDATRHNIRYLTINKRMQFIMREWL
jgi:hypothetical protein